MTHIHITDDYLDRTIPVDSTVGTIEIDLSGDDVDIVIPPDAPVNIEREESVASGNL